MRVDTDVRRGVPLTIIVDGRALPGYEGETVATVMIAAERRVFRTDRRGLPRGLFCNMGTCCECMVAVGHDDDVRMERACLLPAIDGQRIVTQPSRSDAG